MNKKLWVLSLALAVLPTGLTAKVAQAVSLNQLPVNQGVAVGDPVQVQVQIYDLKTPVSSSLSGFDLELNFDPAILQFSSISFGDPGLGDLVNLSNQSGLSSFSNVPPGIIKFAEISLDDAAALNVAQPSSFILATLSFKAIQQGTNQFILTVKDLANENTASLTLDSPPGSATVSVTAVPEPMTILGTGTAIVFGAFFKQNLSKKQKKQKTKA